MYLSPQLCSHNFTWLDPTVKENGSSLLDLSNSTPESFRNVCQLNNSFGQWWEPEECQCNEYVGCPLSYFFFHIHPPFSSPAETLTFQILIQIIIQILIIIFPSFNGCYILSNKVTPICSLEDSLRPPIIWDKHKMVDNWRIKLMPDFKINRTELNFLFWNLKFRFL